MASDQGKGTGELGFVTELNSPGGALLSAVSRTCPGGLGGAEGSYEQLADNGHKPCHTALSLHLRNVRIRDIMSSAPQTASHDADQVDRLEPASAETICERVDILRLKGGLQLRERTERQDEPVGLTIEGGENLTTMPVDCSRGRQN